MHQPAAQDRVQPVAEVAAGDRRANKREQQLAVAVATDRSRAGRDPKDIGKAEATASACQQGRNRHRERRQQATFAVIATKFRASITRACYASIYVVVGTAAPAHHQATAALLLGKGAAAAGLLVGRHVEGGRASARTNPGPLHRTNHAITHQLIEGGIKTGRRPALQGSRIGT